LPEPNLSDYKKARFYQAFYTSRKARGVEKSQNFQTWLHKNQIGNPAVL